MDRWRKKCRKSNFDYIKLTIVWYRIFLNAIGTYLMNMQIPVFSIALEMAFHEATMVYLCLAVSGSRGSTIGAGGSLMAPPALRSEAASLVNWHPIWLAPTPLLVPKPMVRPEIERYLSVFSSFRSLISSCGWFSFRVVN